MFFLSSVYTMLVPFLPLYLIELGVAEDELNWWSGIVFSACFFVAAIMGPIWGKLADAKGKKRMAVRAAIFIGLSYLLAGLVQNEWQLLGMRILQGFANGYMPAAMAIVSGSVPPKKLGVTLGIFQAALVVGGICGPLMGGVIAHWFGMRASFFVGGSIVWAVALAVIFFVHERAPEKLKKEEKTSIGADLAYAFGNRRLRELLFFYFVLQSAILMIQPVTSLYVGELQGSMEGVAMTAGIIMSCGGLAGALTTPLWGKFGQRRGYYRAMAFTFTGAGLLMAGQAVPDSVWGFGLFQFAVGCFIVGINPSLNAAMVECTPDSFRGRVFGISNTAQQMGNMFGPLAAGALATAVSIKAVFLTGGVALFLTGLRIWTEWHGKEPPKPGV